MSQLRFFVPGHPRPQGSKKAFHNPATGRINLVESNKNLKPWREDIIRIAQETAEFGGWEPIPAVHVRVMFKLVRPGSVSMSRRPRPTVKPDLDKLIRAVFDGLTIARVIMDDASVVTLTAAKIYCASNEMPGVSVTLCEPPEMA